MKTFILQSSIVCLCGKVNNVTLFIHVTGLSSDVFDRRLNYQQPGGAISPFCANAGKSAQLLDIQQVYFYLVSVTLFFIDDNIVSYAELQSFKMCRNFTMIVHYGIYFTGAYNMYVITSWDIEIIVLNVQYWKL